MTTEKTKNNGKDSKEPADIAISADAQSTDAQNTPQADQSDGKAAKSLLAIRAVYKYAWHSLLGSAVTAEEKVVGFFNDMEKKGVEFEGRAKKSVTEGVNHVNDSTESIRHKAHDKIVGIEHMIDDGINKSLHFMGVPSRHDMTKLTSMVNDMSESINILAVQMQDQAVKEKRGKSTKTASQSVSQ